MISARDRLATLATHVDREHTGCFLGPIERHVVEHGLHYLLNQEEVEVDHDDLHEHLFTKQIVLDPFCRALGALNFRVCMAEVTQQ